jgi:Uma2 family endonuclease
MKKNAAKKNEEITKMKEDASKKYEEINNIKEEIVRIIEQFAKNAEGQWVLTEYESVNDILSLKSIDFQIPFSDIYEGVNFQ